MTKMFPMVQVISSFLNFRSTLSGSGSQMVMGPIPVSAASAGQDRDQNFPKGPGVQLLFEFLL